MAVKDWACFSCGEPGHTSARCPKGKFKGLVRDAATAEVPALKYTLCLDGDGFVPVDRLTRKTTPLAKATMRPSPNGLTMGEVLGSAFSRLRQLEAE